MIGKGQLLPLDCNPSAFSARRTGLVKRTYL